MRQIDRFVGKQISYLRVVLRGWLIPTWRWRGCLNPRRSSRWWHRGWTLEFLGELSKALSLFAPGAGRGLFATPSSAPAPPEPMQSVHRYHCWLLNTTSCIFIATLFQPRYSIFYRHCNTLGSILCNSQKIRITR